MSVYEIRTQGVLAYALPTIIAEALLSGFLAKMNDL
jgi:hypothetical protein